MQPGRLRIAFATPEYVTEQHFDGGLANYIHRAAKLLADLGHDVHVVTLSLTNEAEFESDGVSIHRVMRQRGWDLLNQVSRYRLTSTLHWLSIATRIYRKLKHLHKQKQFQLIQYPNYSSCGLVSIPLLRTTHVIRASSYQPDWNEIAGLDRNLDCWLSEQLEALQYKLTRNVFAPSNTMRDVLTQKARVANVTVIRTPFYLELEDWDYSVYDQFLQAKQYALYFGRFQEHKGFHILAQALPAFLKQNPEAYAVVVGRDMSTSSVASMAAFARQQCKDVAERLLVFENFPHAQLYPIISGARFVVLPSLMDNSPNTCLEAMGLGKVVIGTIGASFEEVITDGYNGFLVPSNNVDALARKMNAAWIDPNLETIAAAAKQKALEFAPAKTVPALLTYYSNLLNGHSNAHPEN